MRNTTFLLSQLIPSFVYRTVPSGFLLIAEEFYEFRRTQDPREKEGLLLFVNNKEDNAYCQGIIGTLKVSKLWIEFLQIIRTEAIIADYFK